MDEARFHVVPSLDEHFYGQSPAYSEPSWLEFLAATGPRWDVFVDLRAGRPHLVQGEGVPWYPGSGNSLTWEDLAHRGLHPPLAIEDLEDLALTFLSRHPGLLKVAEPELRLARARSRIVQDGAFARVEFDYLHEGIPVEGATVFFRLNHGNLVQFGTIAVSAVDLDPAPSVSREAARAQVLAHANVPDTSASFLDEGSLRIMPLLVGGGLGERFTGTPGTGYGHILAWRFLFRTAGAVPTWEALVDAHTGALVRFVDANRYGVVEGGIFPVTNADPEESRPFPYCWVDNPGANDHQTDAGGLYAYDPAFPASVQLDGRYVRVSSTCGNQTLDLTTMIAPGDLAFGMSGGTDCTTPGIGGDANTHAARTSFFHLNLFKEMARGYLPGNTWLNSDLPSNVDISQACNAYWSPGLQTVNFFRSGTVGTLFCTNTGEISMVMSHEAGHGLDQNDGNGSSPDFGSGEAYGDFNAVIQTHESCIGRNFTPFRSCPYGCDPSCTGVRDVAVRPQVRPSNIASPPADCDRWVCPYVPPLGTGCTGLMGYECHCESLIASGALWDMAVALEGRLGPGAGWARTQALWYTNLSSMGSAYEVVSGGQCNPAAQVDGCGASNWYTVLAAADDDDGNLANGTPNADLIWQAFDDHGIACGANPPPAYTPCYTLQAPVLRARRGLDQIVLEWDDDDPNASSYVVYRGVLGCGRGMVPWAMVTGSPYTDTEATDGFPYFYAVGPVAANPSCPAPSSNCVALTCTPVEFDQVGAVNDACGDGDGSSELNETVLLDLTVRNAGTVEIASLDGMLWSPDPLVNIQRSRAVFGPLPVPPGGTATGRFAIEVDPAHACPANVALHLETMTAPGCRRRFTFELPVSCGPGPGAQLPPGEVPNSLRVGKQVPDTSGLHLDWDAAAGAASYNVYQGNFVALHAAATYNHTVSPGGGICSTVNLFLDDPDDGAFGAGDFYYLVSGESPCGLEGSTGVASSGQERPAGGGCP